MIKRAVWLFLLMVFSLGVFAQRGTVKGRIYNASTNEPLEFCTVSIQGTTIGSTTDLDGNYIFTGVQPGFVRVVASFLGFETGVSPEIQVQGNQTVYVDIALVEKSIQLSEITVRQTLDLKKLDSPVSLLTIGVQQLEKSAGVNRDVSKVVQTLPGVGATNPQRNDLIVRGGGPSENVFYLDGVEMPVINHFATQGSSGGVVGVVNADFVQEINFYTGAFPANRSNALSSVMDIKQRDGSKDRLHTSVTLGASDAAITLDGPIGAKSTFIASARQSYLQFLFQALGLPFLPTYTDFQFKNKIQLNKRNELTFVGIGAIDNMVLNTSLENPTEGQQYILDYLPVYQQWNYTVGAVFKHFSDNHYDSWVLSRNMLRNASYKYQNNDEALPKTQDYASDEAENKLRFERNYPDLPIRLVYGAGLNLAHYTNSTYRMILFGNQPTALTYNTDLTVLAWQLFFQASKSMFDERLTTSFGLNVSGNDYNKPMSNPLNQLSPRLSLSYRFSERITFNANIGRYVMRPAYTSLGFRDTSGTLVNQNEQVRFTGSNQLIAGVELTPVEKISFSVEGFYKQYDHYALSVSDGISMASKGTEYGQVGDEAIISSGKGRAYGLEWLVKIKDFKKVNLTATYTLFRSEFTDVAGVYLPSSWDTRHIVNLMGSVKFGKDYNLAARWRYVGGAPYTPIDASLSSQKAVWDINHQPVLDFNRYNASRLRGSTILDLRLDKEFYLKKYMLGVYVDIQNVFASKTESAPVYTNLDVTGTPVTDPSNQDQYVLRQIDNLNGTILPTLGLKLKF